MPSLSQRALRGAAALICLLLTQGVLRAQEYRFQYFGIDQGLTSLLVQTIYQDHTGFLWVSTQKGVFRYDGERFERFGRSRGLPDMAGAAFAETAGGTLLVGGAAGLFQLSSNHFDKVILPDSPMVSWLHGMVTSPGGNTYIGTSAGLMALTGRRGNYSIRLFPRVPGQTGAGAWGIFQDGAELWYGCGQQLCLTNGKVTRVYGASAGLPPAIWIPIGRALDGDLWVQGRGADIRILPRGATSFKSALGPLPSVGFTGLPAMDGSGYLLFPSPSGLVIRRKDDWWRVGPGSGLHGTVYTAFRDREGSLWLGLEGQGLVRWAGYRAWESYTTASGFNSNLAFQILARPDGSVWVATESGLFHGLSRGQGYVWRKVQSLRNMPIVSMTFDSHGRLWIGTEERSLERLDPATGRLSLFGIAQGLNATSISTLFIDSRQRMWVATEAGVFQSGPPYRRFQPIGALPKTRFWSIVESSNGKIWIGGDLGLFHQVGNGWRKLTTSDGLSRNEVIALGAGGDGTIWVGYRFSGEIDKVTELGEHVHIAHDLRLAHGGAEVVYFFGFDSRRRIWVGTDRGVNVLENGSWIHMDSNDGLVWDDCDGNGFASDPDGSVWIGTSNGLAHFTADRALRQSPPASVVFTRLTLGRRNHALNDSPTVNYRSNGLIAQYSSLDFAHGDSYVYQYRLLPLFAGWRSTARKELEFPELPPGTYRLEVKARNRWAGSTPLPASFSFHIRTPWFRSWWFLALMISALIGAIGALMKMRIASLKRREADLLRLVDERTADLKIANEELYRLSSLDALTGIANRRAFDETLRREWARIQRGGPPLSILLLDVDHFKLLNDAQGHQRGDECLVAVAAELRRIVHRITDLAARYGGEEFVIILTGTGAADAFRFAERARHSISSLGIMHPQSPVARVLTVSIGVGTATRHSFSSIAEFMQDIDRALYTAKHRGRNCVVSIDQTESVGAISKSKASGA